MPESGQSDQRAGPEPYPQAAKYKGSGDPNDAANFECQRRKE